MTVAVDKTKCIGCGACVMECSQEAIDLVDGIAVPDPKKCKDLGDCVKVCPTNALSLSLPQQPKVELSPEAGSKFNLKEPLPESVSDYAQGNEKKTIRSQAAPVAGGDIWSGVWVIIEYNNGRVAPVSWELLGEGRKLSDSLGCELCGVITGYDVDSVIPEAFAYGAEKVYVVDHPVLKDYRTEPYAEAITDLVRKYQPEIILMGATSIGRDVFPAVATKMQTGLTADCTVLGIDPETKLLQQTRPAFGGNIMATILCRSRRPQMATVRPRVMEMPERVEGREGELIREEFSLAESDFRTKVLEFIPADAKSAFLDKAEIIVAVGLGLAAKRNLVLAEELAEVLGATLAGSRGAVEAGWLNHDQQVGQSGVTVRPKVYIAIGISGAIQHLVGMETSDFIIAINNDPEAPILRVANYGIVGDLFQIVPALTSEFKKRLQHGVAN
jgi:electron transfer flavoprotein alpha subunit